MNFLRRQILKSLGLAPFLLLGASPPPKQEWAALKAMVTYNPLYQHTLVYVYTDDKWQWYCAFIIKDDVKWDEDMFLVPAIMAIDRARGRKLPEWVDIKDEYCDLEIKRAGMPDDYPMNIWELFRNGGHWPQEPYEVPYGITYSAGSEQQMRERIEAQRYKFIVSDAPYARSSRTDGSC